MDDPLDPQLSADMAGLKNVPDRQPQAAANGRMQFLKEAASLAPGMAPARTGQNSRWNLAALFGKKTSTMAVRLALIMAFVAVLFGTGGAAAVYAARESLPGEPLYAVKTWGEDVQLALATSPQTELNLNLQFAERRMNEISVLLYKDEELAARSILRLQNHLQSAVQASEVVNGEQALPAMLRLRDHLQYQQRLMQQLQENDNPASEEEMNQSRQMIQEQMRIVEEELQQQLQRQLQHQNLMQEPCRAHLYKPASLESQIKTHFKTKVDSSARGRVDKCSRHPCRRNPALQLPPTATSFPQAGRCSPVTEITNPGRKPLPCRKKSSPAAESKRSL